MISKFKTTRVDVAQDSVPMVFGDDMYPECGNCGEPLIYYTDRTGFRMVDKRSAYYCPRCGMKVAK